LFDLTNEQLSIVYNLLPAEEVRADRRTRPWSNRRKVFNGILSGLRTGAPWKDLSPRYGSYQTAYRRFQNWGRSGGIGKKLLARHLQEVGGLDLKECFLDGTFVPAKKWGTSLARPNAAKAPK
jgi:transposase